MKKNIFFLILEDSEKSERMWERWTYLLHLRAPGQLWIRFWMVGCEKPKKSAPDGTMGTTDFELRGGHIKSFPTGSNTVDLAVLDW